MKIDVLYKYHNGLIVHRKPENSQWNDIERGLTNVKASGLIGGSQWRVATIDGPATEDHIDFEYIDSRWCTVDDVDSPTTYVAKAAWDLTVKSLQEDNR